MNEQTEATLQDQILKILFAEGLKGGAAPMAQSLWSLRDLKKGVT